jgi:sugar phosphate isomerase/epimerase
VKDVTAQRGDPKTFAFWPSVPLGQGLIDLPAILGLLYDARFDGLLALEIDYLAPAYVEAGEEAAVRDSLAYLREQVDRVAHR